MAYDLKRQADLRILVDNVTNDQLEAAREYNKLVTDLRTGVPERERVARTETISALTELVHAGAALALVLAVQELTDTIGRKV